MSQQGGRPTGPEDDWWGQLYDDGTGDTGPAPAPDSLDDRFASASGTLDAGGPAPAGAPPAPAVPAPRPAPAGPPDLPPRAPWEPPASSSPGPVTFPARPSRPPEPPPRPASDPPPPPAAPTTGRALGAWTPATAPPPPPADPPAPQAGDAPAGPRASRLEPPPDPPPSRGYVGSRPPTYDAEPTALPETDPDDPGDPVPDTVLDGARYGACTLRAASVRGDSARYRGEPRRDALLTARFGTGEQALVLVALATGARTAPGAHRAAADACRWIGAAVGRSHARLVDDLRAARRGDLKSGLHRLTDRSLGRLRADAAEQGLEPGLHTATLRCLLLPADPECRTRVFFGVGPGGLFRLREGEWQDIEPEAADVRGAPVTGFGSPPSETPGGDRLTMDLGIPTPPSPYEPAPEPPREPFRFRTSVARPGDTLLMCGTGLADPLRGEPDLRTHLADRWSGPEPPGLTAFLADTQVRVKGYADDRTAVAVWEA
ncbi:protein phosphatase 2C domain-containing protein [Streptomyces fungicidicus]|uniref:protein phosphatase 2C domain-containing protein n=1 Tax=Streptomyces fungicidicus TaxID=68203 RepID=UPI00381F2EC1